MKIILYYLSLKPKNFTKQILYKIPNSQICNLAIVITYVFKTLLLHVHLKLSNDASNHLKKL